MIPRLWKVSSPFPLVSANCRRRRLSESVNFSCGNFCPTSALCCLQWRERCTQERRLDGERVPSFELAVYLNREKAESEFFSGLFVVYFLGDSYIKGASALRPRMGSGSVVLVSAGAHTRGIGSYS